jgi:hypothetical protein
VLHSNNNFCAFACRLSAAAAAMRPYFPRPKGFTKGFTEGFTKRGNGESGCVDPDRSVDRTCRGKCATIRKGRSDERCGLEALCPVACIRPVEASSSEACPRSVIRRRNPARGKNASKQTI